MKLWRRAAGALKDSNALVVADDCLKIAVVKAMTRGELSMDPGNAEFIYRYVRTSPSSIRPLARAISSRVGRTRSWAVALKGLMLVHGFFLGKVPAADSIGRLPFDLSGFVATRSLLSRSSGFNHFVRAYFGFLDKRAILFHDSSLHRHVEESSVMIQLVIIRKMQNLVDSLMRIKPVAEDMRTPLIIDAMDNVITEILEMYRRICIGIAEALPKVHSKTGKAEAEMALRIVAKSISHAEDLSRYFELCKDFHVPKAREIPDFVRIPEEDFMMLAKLVASRMKKEEERAMDQEAEERSKQNLMTVDHNDPPGSYEIPDLISL